MGCLPAIDYARQVSREENMNRWDFRRARALFTAGAALLVTACGSIPMKAVRVETAATADTVLVTFVRPSNLVGDGIVLDLWDGTHYIGALRSATLLQYRTIPGEHLFLGDTGIWSYATGNLLAGKQYFLKANMVPGAAQVIWGAADATDARIPEWRTWPARAPDAAKRAVYESEFQSEVEAAMQSFKDGKGKAAQIKAEDAL
jgi:hypothetical protein